MGRWVGMDWRGERGEEGLNHSTTFSLHLLLSPGTGGWSVRGVSNSWGLD